MVCMGRRNIAVIGGGCSGTVLAWLLSSIYNVKLFEKEEMLGGHIFTHDIVVDNRTVSIDMGVDHINERLCPNVFELLKEIGIDTFIAPLSMDVSIKRQENLMKWSNSSAVGDIRKQFVSEFDRFHNDMVYISSHFDQKYLRMTVSDFLISKGYSGDFAQLALVPLLTSYYGCKAPSLEYSILYVAVSFDMNLLSFFIPGHWRKICGGMASYIRRLSELIQGDVLLHSPVEKVKKTNNKLSVFLENGSNFEFDEVVFATSARDASNCIDSDSIDYKGVLGCFGYVPIESVLHTTDFDFTLNDEYFAFYQDDRYSHGSLTRINRHLYPYNDLSIPLNVTFDPVDVISKDHILCTKKWHLQTLRPIDGLYRSKIRSIQGIDGIWFCGTDTSVTGHEGAVVSAFVLAEKLGVPYKFVENKTALAQFNTVKFIMGI